VLVPQGILDQDEDAEGGDEDGEERSASLDHVVVDRDRAEHRERRGGGDGDDDAQDDPQVSGDEVVDLDEDVGPHQIHGTVGRVEHLCRREHEGEPDGGDGEQSAGRDAVDQVL
jgi:hypothetical protein